MVVYRSDEEVAFASSYDAVGMWESAGVSDDEVGDGSASSAASDGLVEADGTA